jgi:hypothetical protein
MTDSEQIAAFIASRGVTRVPSGESTLNLSNPDWRRVVREPRVTENARINERHLRIINGREHVTNGIGEIVYSEVM